MRAGTDLYDTDPDGSMALSPSPVRPLQDAGVDMQATQAGVSLHLMIALLVTLAG